MKLTIQEIERKPINTKKGPATKVDVKYNGVWYSCFENQINKAWQQGDEIDVQVEKNGQYNNIVFPKQSQQPYTPSTPQMTDAIKMTLERIEKKLDRLLDIETSISNKVMSKFEDPKDIPQMPYEDSPPPSDEDAPF